MRGAETKTEENSGDTRKVPQKQRTISVRRAFRRNVMVCRLLFKKKKNEEEKARKQRSVPRLKRKPGTELPNATLGASDIKLQMSSMSSVCELLFSVLVFACSTTLLIEEAASGMQTTDPEVRFGGLRIIRRLSFGAG